VSTTALLPARGVVRFVAGRGLAATGDQFLLFAVPLLVYRTTGSASTAGLVFLFEWLPRVLFLPVAGVLADRVEGYRLYLAADAVRTMLALTAFVLLQLWPSGVVVTLSVLSAAMSLASAQAYVAMESTLPRFVSQDGMVRAQSVLQGTEQVSMVVGPALAALFSVFLPTQCLLLLTAAVFGTTGANVFFLRRHLRREAEGEMTTSLRDVATGIAQGAAVLRKLPAIVGLIGLTMMANLMIGVGMATSAAITTGTFGKPDQWFGALSTSTGILSVLTFFVIPRWSGRLSPFASIMSTFVLICLGGLGVGRASSFAAFVAGYVLLLGPVGVLNVFIRAERIRRIPREHLGKTIGLIMLLHQLSLPLAGYLVAAFASVHGPQIVMLGAVAGAAFVVLLLLPLVTQLRSPHTPDRPAPDPRQARPLRGRHQSPGPRRHVRRHGGALGFAAARTALHAPREARHRQYRHGGTGGGGWSTRTGLWRRARRVQPGTNTQGQGDPDRPR
jgi:MFS family permease